MPTTATDVQIPAGLPVLPGVALAGRYVLGSQEPSNKGDTLDVITLPGHRVGLVVADVVGNGFAAAIAVSQIKAVLRERLCGGASLRPTLAAVDRYASGNPDMCGSTVVVAILGLDDGDLEWVTAGHPPPVRMAAGRVPTFLPTPPSKPLGTGGHHVTHQDRLGPGDMIALYTNGLVYSEDQPLPVGNTRLLDALAGAAAMPVALAGQPLASDQVCDQVIRQAFPRGATNDDAALLVATRSPPPEPFALHMAAVPQSLPIIRHLINQWLDGLGAGLMDHVGLGHAVVELAANVVAHAYLTVPAEPLIHVKAALREDGVVDLTVSDEGKWRSEPSRGRGLMMAAGLADNIKVNRSPAGTSVTLTQRLTRAVPILQHVDAHVHRTMDDGEEFDARTELGHMVATGPIDDLSVELFEAALSKATRAGTADALIDLSGITHLASTGVQTLFDFLGRSEQTGTSLRLRAPSESPAGQILRLVDLPATL